jgi:hypothetical protein
VPTHLVNLDALIRRADFALTGNAQVSPNDAKELGLFELSGAYAKLLRKGDFQRATSNWDADKIVEFVRSFLDGEVIPSVIMWSSEASGNIFIIDGAHRLSALLAWVHDDYGDGEISKEFWGDSISAKQKKYADITRKMMHQEVLSYSRVKDLTENPSITPDPAARKRAINAIKLKIGIQWITGDAAAAERSFIKINAKPSVLDATERGVLMARRKPNAISTRAIMQAGTGHKPWERFTDQEVKNKIESLSKEIHGLLFDPPLEPRITKPDLPVGGQSYSAATFGMVFDLINMVNEVAPAMWKERKTTKEKTDTTKLLEDDNDGRSTVTFLKKVKKALSLITGRDAGSVGINPIVYCYSTKGLFQPAALLATIKFFLELKNKDAIKAFTKVRKDFEEFLINNRLFVSELGHSKGSRTRPIDSIVSMYQVVFDQVKAGVTDEHAITKKLQKTKGLESLRAVTKKPRYKSRRKDLTAADKNSIYLKETIEKPHRCAICGARLHSQSISVDHNKPKRKGGTVDIGNIRSAHPYCNTGYKESLAAQAEAAEGRLK